MIRTAILLAFIASCFQPHEGNKQEVRSGADCYLCHVTEYEETAAPVHTTGGCSTDCQQCHTTTAWANGLGGCNHPENNFPIAAGPHLVACLDCHKGALGSSVAGANTDCIACHPNDAEQQDSHVGQVGAQGQPYMYKPAVNNFCLECHPDGRANKHPDAIFPRTGPHQVACTKCHDQTIAPKNDKNNANCLSAACHPQAKTDGKHDGEADYMWTTAACLDCHPNGKH